MFSSSPGSAPRGGSRLTALRCATDAIRYTYVYIYIYRERERCMYT